MLLDGGDSGLLKASGWRGHCVNDDQLTGPAGLGPNLL